MIFIKHIEEEVNKAIEKIGAEEKATILFSDRPELSNFQTNVAFTLSKVLRKAPIQIANDIVANISSQDFEAFAVMPGFINFKLKDNYFSKILKELVEDSRAGIETISSKKIVLDYGGPNVAKPLHVGHLRSAVIGETLKRLSNFMGNQTIGDVHLGDWGLQMGLVIAGILERFNCEFFFSGKGEKPLFTEENLEKIYPESALKAKQDEEFKKLAQEITVKLQKKEKGIDGEETR